MSSSIRAFMSWKRREALALVLDQRVALAVAAQPDAFLQVVEAVEVVLPLLVHDLQHDVALELPHELGPEQRFLVRVGLLNARPQRVADLVGAQLVELDAGKVVGLEPVDADHLLLQRRYVPLLDVHAGADEPLDEVVEHVAGQRHQVAVRVGGLLGLIETDGVLEQRPAQRVDVLTLLVHDVVVLEQVLADGEVLRFHLLLRALDGAGHHAVLDRHAFFHPQTLHQAGDAVGPEDAHQVVFERQVEA